jgi:hypothetical protein
VIRRVICALALIASASPAAAQNAILFFPRFDFRMSADHLSGDDARFVWDANFGGETDFVDYGRGRMTFAANYEAVLGEQFRRFDVNQGNYLLDYSTSLRVHGVEVAALFHHMSRHLSDRFKRDPVDWNMLGARVRHAASHGAMQIRAQGDVLGVLLKSNVDYSWEANGGVSMRVPLRPRISMISAGSARLIGVDGTRRRETQHGARGEAGLRFEGQGGAVEVIVAAERRIDPYPYPLENSTMSWFSAGFRFVSR